jgi:type VI secretion system protein ImpG
MRDELLTYYERELTFIRQLAAEFAEKWPDQAGRLLLEPGKSKDPHVERLIEAFALIAARIHLKLDDDFPEITEALLQVLYPHYLAPVPSLSVVQLVLDPDQGKLSTGYTLGRHATLFSKPIRGTTCRFRTCYPVTLWPLEVALARVEVPGPLDADGRAAPAVLRVRLRTTGDARFPELAIDRLRFFLGGESRLAYGLYEALFTESSHVELRPGEGSTGPAVRLPTRCLEEVGFRADEGVLPFSPRSFLGYRLLEEYFAFPEKFLFADLSGLEPLCRGGFDREADLLFFLRTRPRVDQEIDARNFRLGCTTIVNLFPQVAEPIRLDQAHTEYRVVPDARRQHTTEVYSIDQVTGISPSTGVTTEYEPFYSFRHTFGQPRGRVFWHASRRPSDRKGDSGTDVYLTLVDQDFRPNTSVTDALTVRTTCTNRDFPDLLPFGSPDGDFDLDVAAPVKYVVCLTKPTRTLRVPTRHGMQWRLISHLALNYLSLLEPGADGSPEALREILRVYDFADPPAGEQQLAGLSKISSRHVLRRIRTGQGSGFARGIEATLEFDESRFEGSSLYLFSSVLEKFFGLYVSINSFSELVVATRQQGVVRRWPPRAGEQVLL